MLRNRPGDFTKHLLRFRHNNYFGYGNQEVPELVLTDSHDGTAAYRFMSGIFRLVCSNGLVVQSADFGSVKVRHSGGSDFEKRVIDASYEVIEDAPRSLEKIAAWKQVELTPPQREAFAAAALEVRDTTIEVKPSQVLAPRRSDDRGANLWTTANVVQENMIRGGVRGKSATTVRRTYAPIDRTPILRRWDRHDRILAIRCLTVSPSRRRRFGLHFHLLPDDTNVTGEKMVEVLRGPAAAAILPDADRVGTGR